MKEKLFGLYFLLALLILNVLIGCQSQTDQVRDSLKKARKVADSEEKRQDRQAEQAQQIFDDSSKQVHDAAEEFGEE